MPRSTSINLQQHDRLIRQKGDRIIYYPSRRCTCGASPRTLEQAQDEGAQNRSSERARSDCPICLGIGYWWGEAINMMAAAVDINNMAARDLIAAGMAGPGDMMLVLPTLGLRDIQFNTYDKVIFPNRSGQPHDGDVLTRGQYDEFGLTDYTIHPIARLEGITWHDPDDSDRYIREPQESIDYEWTELSNEVRWLETALARPPVGISYHVRYRAHFEWLVFISPSMRVEAGNLLGPRCLLKLRSNVAGMM